MGMDKTLTSKAVAKLVGKSERSVRVVAAEFGLGVLVHPTLRLFSQEDVERFRAIFAEREYVHLTAREKARVDRRKARRAAG